jgi:GNAT superfamily N-acetyltransferase
VPRDAPALGYQQDTLVLREHRGHGLGLALKLANHRALVAALPGVLRVRTWNAVENAHMLAVNTALGFRPSGYSREWHKHLH